MKHKSLLLGLGLAVGCTYKTYKTYNEAPIGAADDEDAGVHESLASGGAGGSAAGGTGGDGGSAQLGGAGGTGLAEGAACTGCVRLSVLPGRVAEYQLELEPRLNLASSLVLFRVRVRDFVGDLQLTAYVESGDHVPNNEYNEEAVSATATLNTAAGWQDVGIDLQPFPPFSPPVLLDAGGTAGGSFSAGFPFDKSRVERIGLRVIPLSQFGLFTPGTVELDAVTSSPQQSLDVRFSSDQGGFELFDPESASVTFVPG
jgi:hypothetical protein